MFNTPIFFLPISSLPFSFPLPLNRQKRLKFRAISDNFRLWARISPGRYRQAENGVINRHSSYVWQKNWWTLVH